MTEIIFDISCAAALALIIGLVIREALRPQTFMPIKPTTKWAQPREKKK